MKANRREFLKTGFTAVAVAALPNIVRAETLGRAGGVAANSRINMGIIGAGHRGMQMLSNFMAWPELQFRAACDVNDKNRKRAKAAIDQNYGQHDCAVYRDLRELLARADLDAVLIATGERWHAPASILAMQAGKDVYSEKPMSLTLAEGRAVAETARRLGRIYQCGIQRRSVGNFVFAVNLARSGKLGRLHTLYAAINEPLVTVKDVLPSQPEPARDMLDWDMWLGPVPWRPYNSSYVSGAGGWKKYTDLAGGGIADWGAHTADLCQMANGTQLSGPRQFSREGDDVVCRYDNGVKLILRRRLGVGSCGVRFEGEAGWVYTDDDGGITAKPVSLQRRDVAHETWTRVVGHIDNFIASVRTRRPPVAPAEDAHRSVSICHIANLCVQLGRPLTWNPDREEFVDDDAANGLRRRVARSPWSFV